MPETNQLISLISGVSGFFSTIISLLTYLAVSYGLYSMAQSLRMKYPVLAWIPYCQTYTLGAVADEHCRRNEGKTTSYRKKLLGWQIAIAASAILLVILLVIYMVVLIVNGLPLDDDTVRIPEAEMNAYMAAAPVLVVLLVALLVFLAIYAVYTVYYYISLHKVFKLFAPEQTTAYLLLSLFVPLAAPILFLMLSKKQPVFTDVIQNTSEEGQSYYSL